MQADNAMDTDAAAPHAAPAENGAAPAGLLPEVEAYAFLLVVTFLVDRKRYEEACARLHGSGSGADILAIELFQAHCCLYYQLGKSCEVSSTVRLITSCCGRSLMVHNAVSPIDGARRTHQSASAQGMTGASPACRQRRWPRRR